MSFDNAEIIYRSYFRYNLTRISAAVELRCRAGKFIRITAEWNGGEDDEIIINAFKNGKLMPAGWAEKRFKRACADVRRMIADEREYHILPFY